MSKGFAGLLSRRAAVAVLSTVLLFAGTLNQRAAAEPATVRLVIDYGDGTIKTFVGLPWKKSMTVLDVMNAAKSRPHGIRSTTAAAAVRPFSPKSTI